MELYPPQRRGRAIGICTSAVYIGGSFGPVVGGFIGSFASWRLLFFVSGALALVSLVLALFALPRGAVKGKKAFVDAPGNGLYVAALALLLTGLTGLTSLDFAWLLMLGGVGLGVAFVLVERRSDEPVVRLSMFTADRVFTLSCLAALLNYGAVAALSYLMSLYFQSVLGWPAVMAGLVLLTQPVMQAVVAPLAGSLSDRVAPWKISTLGMAASCLAFAFFAFMPVDMPIAAIIALLLVAGFGFGIFSSPNTNVIMGRVPPSEFGSANAIVSTMRTVGQASSMSIVTIVMGSMLGSMTFAQAGGQLLSALHVCFGVSVVLCIVGIVCSTARGTNTAKKTGVKK